MRWQDTSHPDVAPFHYYLYRGVGRGRFWVMEQQLGPVNWARWNPAPARGMVRLWTLEAHAHGAEVVSYFRWRQAPFAQEQMHAGLNLPSSHEEERENLTEVATIATLEIAPPHGLDGWLLTVTVEDETGPRVVGDSVAPATEQQIDLSTFYN